MAYSWTKQVNETTPTRTSTHHVIVEHHKDAVHELLTKFWVQEEVLFSDVNRLTPNEQRCEEHFKATHSRDSSGRYMWQIFLKSLTNLLGDSYNTAHHCLKRLLRRFVRNIEYQRLYQQFITE